MLEKIRPYLPSKKILLLLSGCILVVGVIIFISNFDRVKTLVAVKQAKKELGTSTVNEFVSQDTDGDTIPDWEEPLWGTDPNNSDTNGDGISDGDEINQKKNILQTDPETQTEYNETELLSQELFTIINSLSASGTLTNEAMQNIANSFVQSTIAGEDIPNTYTRSMVQTTFNNGPTSLRTYQDALEKVINPAIKEGVGKEMQAIASGIYLSDPSFFQNLSKASELYIQTSEKIIAIENVPSTVVSYHLAIANDMQKIGTALVGMTDMIENPAEGLGAFVIYQNYTDTLLRDINGLGIILQTNGIL